MVGNYLGSLARFRVIWGLGFVRGQRDGRRVVANTRAEMKLDKLAPEHCHDKMQQRPRILDCARSRTVLLLIQIRKPPENHKKRPPVSGLYRGISTVES